MVTKLRRFSKIFNVNSWQPLKKVAFSWHWNYKIYIGLTYGKIDYAF